MAQELTFNISEDRRQLQGPVEAKNFNLKFGTDGSAITHGKPDQWVQGRIGDDQLKQVFVNITEGEGNTPKDVAGMFLAFVGIIHDKDGRPHRVVDYKHSTTIDVEHGRFRFDFPDQAFTVAGEYQQAFFMLIKEGPGGGCVATMEFDMQVMANFVFTDLVPEDYITPFNDTVDQLLAACKKFKDDTAADEAKFKQELEDAYAKFQKDTNTQFNNFKDATDEDLANFKKANADDIAKFKQQYADAVQAKEDELQSKVDSYTDKIDTMLKDLNQQGIDTTTMLTNLRSQMAALQDKINSEHLFTEDEALKFEGDIKALIKSMQDKLDGFLPDDVINIKQFGAAGDGVTDDSSVFQKAINTGKEIFVPNGIYKIDTMLLPKDESTPLVIHGQTPGKVILKSAQSRIMDFTTAKHLVMSNLSSDNEMHLIDYDPDTNDHTQDRFIQLDNIWNNSADSKVINWNHLVVTPKMDEDPLAGDLKHHSGKYARYPLEIYNNGGFNALNINNSSQSVEASAIGITDSGGKEVPLSSPIILIDQQGQRAYLKVNKKGSDYPSIEAVDNHLAIGAKDSTDDGGIANLKIGEKTWPTIMMVERDSKTNASIVYNKNKFMFVFSNGSPVNVTSEGLQTTREIQIKTNGTEGYTIVREDLDPNKGVKTFYLDSKGQLRVSYGYASNPDSAGGLVQYCQAGPSEQRPKLTSDPNDIGFMFFDRTLGKPIWWNGVDWVSADITAVSLGKQVANLTAQNAELKVALSNLGKQTAQLIADQGKKG